MGKNFGSTNQANRSQATNGAPLTVSIYTVHVVLITGNFVDLPTAINMPNGNPATTATEANKMFNRNPPQRLDWGPPPIINILKANGIRRIQREIKLFFNTPEYVVFLIIFEPK